MTHFPPTDAEHALATVIIQPHARQALVRRLYLTGRTQWGVVLGQRLETALQVHHFALHGSVWGKPTAQPSRWDTCDLLGSANALVAEHGSQIDWRGLWRVNPNSCRPDAQDVLNWVTAATEQGLCHEHSPLLTAGWDDGLLTVHAYHLLDNRPTKLPVQLLR